MQTSPQFDPVSAPVLHPPISSAELRALKRSEWFVGGVGLAFFACVFVWGNSHRERVTVLVLPTIALTAFVVTRAAWRLRKALSESERKFYKATKSE